MSEGDRRGGRFAQPVNIQPSPTPEEAAAIVAALEALEDRESGGSTSLKRSRWRLAGLLGHEVEPGMKLEGSLWSYSRWGGIA
jgi:predicted DNA-binding transcriptional regulator YafY